jgi:hypothetical protein
MRKRISTFLFSVAMVATLAMSVSANTAVPTLSDSLTVGLFTGILTELFAVVVIMIPAIAGFWGFRKVWAFIRTNIKKA